MLTRPLLRFDASIVQISKHIIVLLPESESVKLPSRGQVMVRGTINDHDLRMVLEPDGRWGHWFKLDATLQKDLGVAVGDTVRLAIAPSKDWPEPTIPNDLKEAFKIAPQKVKDKWHDITPMARWEWIRWMNATLNQETRAVRIEKTISKLNGTHRRPCCFNLAACTDPEVAKGGRLMQPND